MSPSLGTADAGKVRLGAMSPVGTADAGARFGSARCRRRSHADAGKVRLGAMSPSLSTADAGKVRLGAMSPSLSTADAGKVASARCRVASGFRNNPRPTG